MASVTDMKLQIALTEVRAVEALKAALGAPGICRHRVDLTKSLDFLELLHRDLVEAEKAEANAATAEKAA